MRYIAIINTDIPLTEHDIQFIKNTIFCGNEQVPYVFEIEDIKCKGESEQSYTRKEIEKMLKDTYLEVSNMDLKTKHLGDAQTVACSKFRNIMVDKLSKTEKVVETPWYMQIFNQDILNEYQKRMRDATPEERQSVQIIDSKQCPVCIHFFRDLKEEGK